MTTRTVTDKPLRIEEEDTVWLYALLAAIQRDVAAQPQQQTIERIRARLLAAMDRPVRAAA